jgi:hypothetical protein
MQLEPATSDLAGEAEAEGPDESCPSDIFEDHKWQFRECTQLLEVSKGTQSDSFFTPIAIASKLYFAMWVRIQQQSNERETI